jgi:ubiquinone/menaquinone biosynthesis C-methylase UbiE
MKWLDLILDKNWDSTKRFSSRVANYQKYRPNYPLAAIDYIYTALALEHKVIADIGAGTGLMTEHFLKRGNIVYAVEPNKEMRSEAEKILGHYENFKAVDGTAEHTTLSARSIDCLVCAQSFHWFKLEQAKKEFLRILKYDGTVVLIWNKRVPDSPFAREYEKLLVDCAHDYQHVGYQKIDDTVFSRFFRQYTKTSYRQEQSFKLAGFKGRVFSSSYTPQAGDRNYEAFMTSLEKLFLKYQVNGTITFSYNTEVVCGSF